MDTIKPGGAWLVLVTVLAVSGCQAWAPMQPPPAEAAKAPPENHKPELRRLTGSGRIYFGYRIWGDPGAAPSQVFDDGVYQYLQFKQGEPPPIPFTHDGRLLEYEVLQGGLTKILKQPAVVLRLGPRVAYVEHADVRIIGLPGSSATPSAAAAPSQRGLSAEMAPSAAASAPPRALPPAPPRAETLVLDLDEAIRAPQQILGQLDKSKRLFICHYPSVQELRRVRSLVDILKQAAAVEVVLSDACTESGRISVTSL
ncbi:MAG: TrbG/VirB9 family P-type conjugative transfer protein [Rhodocyclaceae bacterium]|nr:TrbG/VirB9 family P-type conjugative transfer protein [Rhodocyclaceae bacterium]